jgi:uncharacterized protein YcfL
MAKMGARTLLRTAAMLAAGLLPWAGGAGTAAAQTLDIELNKLTDADGQCMASLLLTNRLSETLDQVRFDLYVFDKAGVIARRLLLDTGPMRVGKTTVASFALIDQPCGNVSRLLVSDVPLCKTAAGDAVDCVAALNLTSRAAVPLAK